MWEKHLKRCLKLNTSLSLGSVQHLGIPRHCGNKTRQISAKETPQQHPRGVRELCALHTPLPAVPNPAGALATGMHHLSMHFQSPGLCGGMGRQAAPDASSPVDIGPRTSERHDH